MEGHRDEEAMHTGPVRGEDVEVTVELTFDEAMRGVRKRIDYRLPSTGERKVREIKFPAGSVDGLVLVYEGHGDWGTDGGERGDLAVMPKVPSDGFLSLDGLDIHMSRDVDAVSLQLGCPVYVVGLRGEFIKLYLPEDTKDGMWLRLEYLGAPDARNPGNAGDLIVTFRIRDERTGDQAPVANNFTPLELETFAGIVKYGERFRDYMDLYGDPTFAKYCCIDEDQRYLDLLLEHS